MSGQPVGRVGAEPIVVWACGCPCPQHWENVAGDVQWVDREPTQLLWRAAEEVQHRTDQLAQTTEPRWTTLQLQFDYRAAGEAALRGPLEPTFRRLIEDGPPVDVHVQLVDPHRPAVAGDEVRQVLAAADRLRDGDDLPEDLSPFLADITREVIIPVFRSWPVDKQRVIQLLRTRAAQPPGHRRGSARSRRARVRRLL